VLWITKKIIKYADSEIIAKKGPIVSIITKITN